MSRWLQRGSGDGWRRQAREGLWARLARLL